MLPDVLKDKLLDGKPARFLRDYGPHKFVVEVDGHEYAILREVWYSLPFVENFAAPTAPADDKDKPGARPHGAA